MGSHAGRQIPFTLFLDEESVQVRRSIDAIWIRGKVLVYEVRIDLGFRHSSRST